MCINQRIFLKIKNNPQKEEIPTGKKKNQAKGVPEWLLQFYFDMDSQVVNYLIDNYEWAQKRYGEKCTSLLKSMASNPAWNLTLNKEASKKIKLIEELQNTITNYPFLSSTITDFTLKHRKSILKSDIPSLSKKLLKESKKWNDSDKQNLLIFLTHLAQQRDFDKHKPLLIDTADKLSETLTKKLNLSQLLF